MTHHLQALVAAAMPAKPAAAPKAQPASPRRCSGEVVQGAAPRAPASPAAFWGWDFLGDGLDLVLVPGPCPLPSH